MQDAIKRVSLVYIAGEAAKGAISTNRFMLAHNTFPHNTYDTNVILGFKFSELMQLKTCDSRAKGYIDGDM